MDPAGSISSEVAEQFISQSQPCEVLLATARACIIAVGLGDWGISGLLNKFILSLVEVQDYGMDESLVAVVKAYDLVLGDSNTAPSEVGQTVGMQRENGTLPNQPESWPRRCGRRCAAPGPTT